MINRRALLLTMLLMMIFIFLLLVFILYRILQPAQIGAVKRAGIQPVLSIYGFGKNKSDFFMKPHDVAVDKEKNLYVSDTRNSRIVKLTLSGQLISIIGKEDNLLSLPLGIDVSSDGRLYVCDRGKSSLFIFDSQGNLIRQVRLLVPLKPKVAGERVYVATSGSIAVFDLDGNFLFHWGRYGKKPGEFAYPNGIAVDDEGNIYVSDLNNLRVQAFSPRGDLLWVKGAPPKDILQRERVFGLPAGCVVAEDGNLYVVDAFQDRIISLRRKDGEIIRYFGGERGEEDGQFNQPSGIANIEGDFFAIADKYNDRIQLVRLVTGKKAQKENSGYRPGLRDIIIMVLSGLAILVAILKVKSFIVRRRN